MRKDYELSSDHLIVGEKQLITEELVVPSGTIVQRGDVVSSNASIITDTTVVFGIVANNADGTTGATKTVVYTEGEFNIEEVNYGSATKEKVIDLCRDRNIYLRELGGKN